jgi:hypothetical protein
MDINKVEVRKCDKYYQLWIALRCPTYGLIFLRSDKFSNVYEADSRAFVVAKMLGLDRDNLPVHHGDGSITT